MEKRKRKRKKAINETELEEYPITLSLKCPSCNWEWSETIIFLPPSLSAMCPKCFHLKPATVNKHISILKAMIKKAVDWNMVEEETLKRARRVKLLTENNKRLRYLSKEECQSLINACDQHLRPAVITALNTGARKEEILSLKWDNVDLKHGFILLDRTKTGDRREIPINDTLRVTFT